jgi:mono/diheme cytochrome c family protein
MRAVSQRSISRRGLRGSLAQRLRRHGLSSAFLRGSGARLGLGYAHTLGMRLAECCVMDSRIAFPSVWLLMSGLAACSGGAPAPSPASMEVARELYSERCAKCHGATGKGDGPEAPTLKTKPRNFGDFTWQLAVSDRHLEEVIREGGPVVGKSADMRANPDLAKKPELVAALRQHVRELAAAE